MLEVATRLGVSAHRLYKRIKPVAPSKDEIQSARLVEAEDESQGETRFCPLN